MCENVVKSNVYETIERCVLLELYMPPRQENVFKMSNISSKNPSRDVFSPDLWTFSVRC